MSHGPDWWLFPDRCIGPRTDAITDRTQWRQWRLGYGQPLVSVTHHLGVKYNLAMQWDNDWPRC